MVRSDGRLSIITDALCLRALVKLMNRTTMTGFVSGRSAAGY